jgi:hypothetical protein
MAHGTQDNVPSVDGTLLRSEVRNGELRLGKGTYSVRSLDHEVTQCLAIGQSSKL